MRTEKAIKNIIINMIAFLISFLPNFIIRKLFLETLGGQLLGLNSLYSNIIGWLSIIEMGIGVAIIYSLYKPYANRDYPTIRAYIRFYDHFYKRIGMIILIAGIIFTPFLKYFIKGNIDPSLLNVGFILFLINSFITYLFSSRLCILIISQNMYKITIATTISKLLTILLQIILLKIYPNFLLFITIQLIVNFIYIIIINLYILKKYSWINKGKEELCFDEKKHMKKNMKAMFMHKIGSMVVDGTDNIVISKFIGLNSLAKYTNYQMIIFACQSLVSQGLNGITASIGNLLSDDNKEKAYEIHKKIFFLNFWVVSFITITLFNALNQFIVIWVGEEYLIDNATFIIILFNFYFNSMRGSVEQFQSASGNFYQDRYAAFFESIINLISSLILVKYFGLFGVFLGTLISNFTVIFWTKPYVVYKYVFDKKIILYFKMYFSYLGIGIITLIIVRFIVKFISIKYIFINLIFNFIINIIFINLIYILLLHRTKEFKYYLGLIKLLIIKLKDKIK